MPRPSLTDEMEKPMRIWPLADLPVPDEPTKGSRNIPFDAPIDVIDDFRRPPLDCPRAEAE